ncbi:MAG: hypothetical protein AB1898_12780 [Acidobacteriota bacterium]
MPERRTPRFPALNEARKADPENNPAREEHQEIHRADVKGRALSGPKGNDHQHSKNGKTATGRFFHRLNLP